MIRLGLTIAMIGIGLCLLGLLTGVWVTEHGASTEIADLMFWRLFKPGILIGAFGCALAVIGWLIDCE